ncbi:hypothetical protein ebA3032 [Aromatoleum aromaticum EbN1]|uniref:Uncharacterized protein n=1 Tax=Aromatoleum aromaticum (strain DSM 19018 / LMG 30748 / EbN1) TaxID=76114 RepID=Q5P4C9_AROAE|nr:hypothetical protein ebA3032 [Aromatoleum aromaticum EbN1]
MGAPRSRDENDSCDPCRCPAPAVPYSITLGTRYSPASVCGAMRWNASRRSDSVATSGRRRCATSCGWLIGSTPVVSTACICSIRPKMPFSLPRVASASASESSMRASVAMRRTCSVESDMR